MSQTDRGFLARYLSLTGTGAPTDRQRSAPNQFSAGKKAGATTRVVVVAVKDLVVVVVVRRKKVLVQ